jgi:hypothetical protein
MAAIVLFADSANGAVTTIALYELEGTVGASVAPPVDTSGNANHFQFDNNPGITTFSADASPATGSTTSANFPLGTAGNSGFYFTANPFPQDNFGFEIWAKTTQAAADGHLIGNSDNTSGIEIGTTGSNWYAAIASVAFISQVPIVDNVWTNLALVRDSGVTSFYLNGVFVASSALAPFAVPGANAHFGVDAGGGSGYEGLADHARFFSFAPGQFSPNDLSVNQTPEPSTAVLVGLGILCVAGRRSRKSRSRSSIA